LTLPDPACAGGFLRATIAVTLLLHLSRGGASFILFPDAVQREALAKRCTADPGSFHARSLERSRVSSAPRHKRVYARLRRAMEVLRCARDKCDIVQPGRAS